ncbi:MAG TPA: 2-phosphosulfolactate phosphatase, partial [Isosphaeraceae bacterium]
YVHLLPALVPPGALRGGVAVVIDILRATTVMAHGLDAGAEAIVPCLNVEQALATADRIGRDRALLAGEVRGEPIPGFDLSNSPSQFTPDVCLGKTIVMTTTNGTKALLASLEADRVIVGAFVNSAALVHTLRSERRPIHLVCSGTDGNVSFEDTLFAGELAEALHGGGPPSGNDSVLIARSLIRDRWLSIDRESPDRDAEFARILELGRGGKRNLELGLRADVTACARWDRFDLVGELRREPLAVVRVS